MDRENSIKAGIRWNGWYALTEFNPLLTSSSHLFQTYIFQGNQRTQQGNTTFGKWSEIFLKNSLVSWLVCEEEVKSKEGQTPSIQEQSPLLLLLDFGSESADWGLSRLSIIQSIIHSWPIGFPCLGLLLGVKWSAGTLFILIFLSIRPHSSVNESVCQSDRFWCCRFPEQRGLSAGAGNWTLDEKLDVGFHNSSATSW